MMLGWLNEDRAREKVMFPFQTSIAKAHLDVLDGRLCILGLCEAYMVSCHVRR